MTRTKSKGAAAWPRRRTSGRRNPEPNAGAYRALGHPPGGVALGLSPAWKGSLDAAACIGGVVCLGWLVARAASAIASAAPLPEFTPPAPRLAPGEVAAAIAGAARAAAPAATAPTATAPSDARRAERAEGDVAHCRLVDRTGYGVGPWNVEPDAVDFVHAGLPCRLWRSARTGAWHGAVGLPRSHPLYNATPARVVRAVAAHGLVRRVPYFAPFYARSTREECALWKDHDLWGFACDAPGDFCPRPPVRGVAYRDLAFARATLARLADQFAAYAEGRAEAAGRLRSAGAGLAVPREPLDVVPPDPAAADRFAARWDLPIEAATELAGLLAGRAAGDRRG